MARRTRLHTGLTRRQMLSMSVIGAGGLILSSPAVLRAQARTLRLGHQWPVDHPNHLGVQKAAEIVAEKTSGRLTIQIFPSSQLGTGMELAKQINNGSLDIDADGPGIIGQWQKPLAILDAPFVVRDWNHLLKIMTTKWAQDQFKRLADENNITTIGEPLYYGMRHMTTRNRALKVPADVKGLKIRVPQVPHFLDMVLAIGGTPTPMPLAEVYLSLQTGVIDGQENPLATIDSLKFHEVQKYINLTGHILNPQWYLVSTKTWRSLSKPDQAVLQEAFTAGSKVTNDAMNALETKLLDKFKGIGLNIVDSDRAAFQAAMKPVYQKYESIWGAGVYASLQGL